MSSPSLPSPFTISVPGAVLRDLADRLARTRFPQRTAAPWQAGTDPDYLRELVTYWHDDFDWRARERELSALPQFTAAIDGQRVHFVHIRAAGITLTPEDRDYPREYAERSYSDIRQWTGPTRGGHFLALEEPALLAADLRTFFRPLRGS